MTKKTALKSLACRRLEAGKASDFVGQISELKAGDRVVVYCRVSHRTQKKKNNLETQKQSIVEDLTKRGLKVIADVCHVGSGWDPWAIFPCVKIAMKYGAVIVAEAPNRFARHPCFHSSNAPNLQARKLDLENLSECAFGVRLLTVLSPDASPAEEKSFQTKRGINSKGGKPKTKTCKPRGKERRQHYLRLAMRFRNRGASYREIAEILNSIKDDYPPVSYTTVGNWLRRR